MKKEWWDRHFIILSPTGGTTQKNKEKKRKKRERLSKDIWKVHLICNSLLIRGLATTGKPA
jgi:hypothetical protein